MGTTINRSVSFAAAVPFHFDELAAGPAEPHEPSSLIAQAHVEADAIRRRAEEQGRLAGLEAAEQILDEKVSRRVASVVSALEASLDGIDAVKAEWLGRWEQMAVHLAVAIAGRVIRREVERVPEITLDLVREALELAASASDVQLRLHPDDYQALGSEAERIAAELSRVGQARIVSDPQITKGACKVDTRHGSIDQQFEAQLARIEQELS